LHYSTKQVLKDAAKAVILSRSLVSLMDRVVQEACAKGPALSEHGEETPLGEMLISVLLLSFFSMRRLVHGTQNNWPRLFSALPSLACLRQLVVIDFNHIICQVVIKSSRN
jgi:hypothetical protein